MMKDVRAVDILGQLDPVPLDDYSYVRIPQGRDHRWIYIEIRDGDVCIRGSHGLLLRPIVSNELRVKLA